MFLPFLPHIDESQVVFRAIVIGSIAHLLPQKSTATTLCGIAIEQNREYLFALDEEVANDFRCPTCYASRKA
jgi:hypothetical protein